MTLWRKYFEDPYQASHFGQIKQEVKVNILEHMNLQKIGKIVEYIDENNVYGFDYNVPKHEI